VTQENFAPASPPPWTSEMWILLFRDEPFGNRAAEWATAALTAGFDSPALRTLAGLDVEGQVHSADARPLLQAALLELGAPPPVFEEAARQYLRDVASAVVSTELAPQLAADLVHRRVVDPLNHPEDLMPWCYVWEGNAADCSRQLEPEEFDAEIVKVAEQFCSRG
jgi:hypothetical protein